MHTSSIKNVLVNGTVSSSNLVLPDKQDFSVDSVIKSDRANWASLVASRSDATNPYYRRVCEAVNMGASMLYSEVTPKPVSQTARWKSSGLIIPGNTAIKNLTLQYDDATNDLAFQAKLYDDVVKFQLPTFLGELRETYRMIRHPLKGIREGVDRLALLSDKFGKSTKKYRSWRRLDKDARDLWLEWSFGIKPFVADVEAAVTAYRSLADTEKFKHFRYRSVASWETSSYDGNNGFSNLYWAETEIRTFYREYFYRSLYSFQNQEPPSKLDMFGLNWQTIPLTVWELIPWSFLIDYFFTIEKALSSAVVMSMVEPVYISRSRKQTVNQRTTIQPVSKPNVFVRGTSTRDQHIRLMEFDRKAISLEIRRPVSTFDPNQEFSAGRILNIAALFGYRNNLTRLSALAISNLAQPNVIGENQ